MFNFSVCPDEAIPLTGNGKFSSPNYPIDNYLPSKFCTWTITVSGDKSVKFAFTNFALGSCSLECSSDTCTYVEVYDGPTASSPLLARFCHGSAEEEKISSGNQMFVKFHAGFSLGPGFEAQYSETTPVTSNYLYFLFKIIEVNLHVYENEVKLGFYPFIDGFS